MAGRGGGESICNNHPVWWGSIVLESIDSRGQYIPFQSDAVGKVCELGFPLSLEPVYRSGHCGEDEG